jgi:primase-polymerase (primpol)-like protein
MQMDYNTSSIYANFDCLPPAFDVIPDELTSHPWGVWIAEPRKGQPGKFNKAPRNPITGVKVGSDKPELFGTFKQAKKAYETGRYTGVGVLLTGNGVIGVDIDDAENTFRAMPEVKRWVATAIEHGVYCEKSPSNTGLRLFMYGSTLPVGKMRKHGKLEIYDDKRFLTVTGHVVKGVK